MKRLITIILSLLMLFVLCSCAQKTPPNQKEVTLYYANDKYIETGDETLDKFVIVKREITIEDNNLILSILNELKKDPEIENASTGIPTGIKFLNGKVEDKIAYVDVSSENLGGGSLQEFFVINQVVYSLTSLEDVEKVQFLIDGKKEESFMGHFLIDEPLERNSDSK